MTEVASYPRPLPGREAEWAPFWEALRHGQFVVQHCDSCARYQHQPARVCMVCGGKVAWRQASGRGVVHTYIVMHQVYHPGFKDQVPYNVTVVELAEGPMLVTNLVGVANDEIRIGAQVEIVFDEITPDATLPRFRPAQAGGAQE